MFKCGKFWKVKRTQEKLLVGSTIEEGTIMMNILLNFASSLLGEIAQGDVCDACMSFIFMMVEIILPL